MDAVKVTRQELVELLREKANSQLASGHAVLDHTKNGNCVAVKVELDGKVTRFNANSQNKVVLEFCHDLKVFPLVAISETVASGKRLDTSNRKTARAGLYAYSNHF